MTEIETHKLLFNRNIERVCSLRKLYNSLKSDNAELSYMPWQADEDSSVVCPDCDYKFKINFGGDR